MIKEGVDVIHLGDTHIVKGTRWAELNRVHNAIADDIAKRKPKLITHGGDVYHRDTCPEERNAAIDWFMRLADIAPVVIARGNHDTLGDLTVFSKLRTRHQIFVEEEVGIHETEHVIVLAVAWPRKGELLSRLSSDASLQASTAAGSSGLKSILLGYGMQLDQLPAESRRKPRILLMHAMVRGSRTGPGQPLVGCDWECGVDDLASSRCDFGALSHIHMGQEFKSSLSPMKIVYPASTYRVAYGEVEQKGYVLIKFSDWPESSLSHDPEQADGIMKRVANGERFYVSYERIASPATPMILLEGKYDSVRSRIQFEDDGSLDPGGADIRLRYNYDSEFREAAEEAANRMRTALLQNGAVAVTLDPVKNVKIHARMPELTAPIDLSQPGKALTVSDKIKRYWKYLDKVPTPEEESQLLSKLSRLEMAALPVEE